MKNTALIFAGLVFLFVAGIHLVRYLKGWEIMIAHQSIPLNASIYGGIVAVALAIWMFVAAKK